jgi:hypothetical protein
MALPMKNGDLKNWHQNHFILKPKLLMVFWKLNVLNCCRNFLGIKDKKARGEGQRAKSKKKKKFIAENYSHQ